MSILSGTAHAPLSATRDYTFFARELEDGTSLIWMTTRHRGTWDDYGEAEHLEQETWMSSFVRSLGLTTVQPDYPGSFCFVDRPTRERVWSALESTLVTPLSTPPTASRSCELAKDAGSDLAARFIELTTAVLGVGSFTSDGSRIDTSGPEQVRTESWRARDGRSARLRATAIESGYGVHGEVATLSLDRYGDEQRDVRVEAKIDARSGGHVSVTVTGVLDADALAAQFIEHFTLR